MSAGTKDITAPATPAIKCRCCGTQFEPVYQTPFREGKAGFWYLTCETPGCRAQGHTFTDRNYNEIDFSQYQHKGCK